MGVLGEKGGNIALFDVDRHCALALSLQVTWDDWEQYEHRYEIEPKLMRLKH